MSNSRVSFNGNFSLGILAINYALLRLIRFLPDCFYENITYSGESWRMLRISFFFFFWSISFEGVSKGKKKKKTP